MEGLPKLLPLWHDVTLKDDHTRKCWIKNNLFPDHGGAGIDLSIRKNMVQCEELKTTTNIANFGSDFCALPFLSPNKVEKIYDPCLRKLNRQKEKQKLFCKRLEMPQCLMKKYRSFRNTILSAHAEASAAPSDTDLGDLSLPSSVLELAKLFPKQFPAPRARFSYTGGCLTAVVLSDTSHLLLYPTGKKLNRLAITSIKETSGESKIMVASENKKREVRFGGGHISQITAELSASCCVRQKKKYHYVNLNLARKKKKSSNFVETFEFEDELSYISMSKYIPGENVIATKTGFLFLHNAERKDVVWQLNEPLVHNPVVEDMWWGCSFGSHPRSILYYDRLCFSALDIRVKRPKSVDILTLPNPFTGEKENIMLAKRLGDHYFQHLVATDVHLFVFDERYPQQPVMSWNHMLETVPLYCDVKPYDITEQNTDLLILLATQESRDIASFHLRTFPTKIQPFSLSFPLHLSKPSDSIETLRLHCKDVSEKHIKRTLLPLVGVCAIPHSNNIGYTVLQATSLGDIFYQDFKLKDESEKTYRIEPGCILIPPNNFLPHLSEWLSSVDSMGKKKKNAQKKLSKKIEFKTINRRKFLKIPKKQKIAANCAICLPSISQSVTEELDDLKICPSCGLKTCYGKKLMETASNLGVLAGVSSSESECSNDSDKCGLPSSLKLVDFSKTNDPLSQKFLKPWLEESSQDSSCNVTSKVLETSSLKSQSTTIDNPGSSQFIQESPEYAFSIDEFLSQSQVSLSEENFIPPSQDMSIRIYPSKQKDDSRKMHSKSVSGF